MGGYAWVTLATNDSYSLGALVLAHSLKQVGTKQQLAVLITPGVTGPMRSKLSEVFNVVQEVNILDSKDEANLRLLKRPELGVTFTKLHCWRLTQFEKCVFLDADTLVLENCDELFDREELSAAPDIGWPDCFNSGVFVYRPSNETYEKLIQFALEKGSFDGGDQGLLNLYFSDWAYKDISKHLPFIYNMASNACYSYLPAFKQFGGNAKIIHFIGTSKPWLQYFDTETKQVHPSQGYDHLKIILQHWWNIFCSLIHPQLTPDMTTRHTDNLHGSQPSYPPENHSSRNYHTSSSYNQYENIPQPAFNPAEHYQNVWDPWEDYDSRQIQIETVLNVPPHEPYHQPETQTFHDTYHYDSHYHETPSNSQETHNNHSDSTFDQPTHNTYHDNIVHHQNPTTAFHHPVIHNQAQSSSCQSDSSTYHIPESNTDTSIQYHNPPVGNHHQPHSEYVEKHSHSNHSEQKQLFKSHNTNACTDASHCQFGQPHTQGYSPPQSQSIAHNDPPVTPTQEVIYITKNDQYPTLLEENVANQIVSDDVTVQLIADEDKHNDAGIAGAFAKLTLGQPRTPEQLALDDHLRRQGWEVGNIDYLGRDSFDNIWSKICETLSTGPASDPPKAKDPSPPRSEAPTVEQPVLEEVKTDIIPTSEPVTETHPPQASTNEAKPGDAVQPIEEPLKPAEDAPKIEPQSEPSKPTEEIPKPAPEPPKSAVEPLTPEVQSPSPAAEPPKSITEVPKSVPEPLQSVEDIPKLATEPPKPAVESPKSASEPPKPAPEPPQPVTEPLKPTEEPTKSVESPPSAVVPTSPVTEALKTVTESPKSVTEIPEPVPESPKPATESIKPAVEPPKPVQEPSKPKPESPIAVTEPAKLESKQADPPKAVAEPSKPEKKSKTDEPSKETPETPTAEKSASEISSPLVCPIKPKQPAAAEEAKEKEEKKAKKVKDTPKAEVTEATPPSSPLSPQLKQTKESLNVETTVPDTPPPASQESSSTGPTPPPRKGSSGTKKTATKAKK